MALEGAVFEGQIDIGRGLVLHSKIKVSAQRSAIAQSPYRAPEPRNPKSAF